MDNKLSSYSGQGLCGQILEISNKKMYNKSNEILLEITLNEIHVHY